MAKRLILFRVKTTDRAFEDVECVRGASAEAVAKWTGGKLAQSCPGWARIVREGKPDIQLFW